MRRAVALLLLMFSIGGCEMALSDREPYATIRVEARSRAGEPLPGIRALLYTGRRPLAYGFTGEDGDVVFRLVPPGGVGIWMTLPDDYADLSEFGLGPVGYYNDRIFVTGAEEEDIRVSFTFIKRGIGALEARVVDTRGAPIEGLTLDFYRSSGVVGRRVTDADGFVRVDSVLMGVYGVAFIPPDSLGVRNAPFTYRDGLFVDGETVPRAEFTVPTCFGTFVVEVRDQTDVPVPGVNIARYLSSGRSWGAVTDANGRHVYSRVPCLSHGVTVLPGTGYSITIARGVSFNDNLPFRDGDTLFIPLRVNRP